MDLSGRKGYRGRLLADGRANYLLGCIAAGMFLFSIRAVLSESQRVEPSEINIGVVGVAYYSTTLLCRRVAKL